MARSSRSVAIVSALVAVMVAFAGCSKKNDAETPTTGAATGEPIIIGLDQDSTGPGASYSNISGKTIRLAVQEINDKGGVLGRPLKLVVENDESDPTKVPATIQKLVSQGAKLLLLQSGSGVLAHLVTVHAIHDDTACSRQALGPVANALGVSAQRTANRHCG